MPKSPLPGLSPPVEWDTGVGAIKDNRERAQRRRVGWRLLVLLWIWAACVFLLVDLLFNVPEFDRIRPRSTLYRATRYAGHELSGVPYEESDEFARRSDGRSDPEALTEVRQRVAALGQTERDEVYLDVAEATLRRVDLRDVKPPPQFRGTPLGWRLHGRVDTDELAQLLGSLLELSPRDRKAVLRRVLRDPNPRLASAMIKAKKSVGGPTNLLLWAAAARSVVKSMWNQSDSARTSVAATGVGEGADLVQALLESLVRVVTRFRPHLNEPQWRGVFATLSELRQELPGFESLPRYRSLIAEIRAATGKTLVEAAMPEPNYMGRLETVRVGILLADESMWDVLLDLLRARAVFNQKIASTQSRTDLAFLEMVASGVTHAGSERQRSELARVIETGLRDPDEDASTRSTLARLGASLLKKLSREDDPNTVAALEAALESSKGIR